VEVDEAVMEEIDVEAAAAAGAAMAVVVAAAEAEAGTNQNPGKGATLARLAGWGPPEFVDTKSIGYLSENRIFESRIPWDHPFNTTLPGRFYPQTPQTGPRSS